MKHVAFLTVLYAAAALAQEQSASEATLTLGGKHTVRTFELKLEAGNVRCATKGVPPHRIEVDGLRSLGAPYKDSPIAPNCEQKLTWRARGSTASTCHRYGQNKLVDEILRWCMSL